jgi:hypothetical protein
MGEPVASTLKPVIYFEQCLPADVHDSIYEHSASATYKRDQSTPHLNNCNYIFNELIDWVVPTIEHNYRISVRNHKGHSLQIFTTGESMGAHQDFAESYADPSDFAPTVSVVYYVNQEFNGGEICFSSTNPWLTENINDNDSFAGTIKIKPTSNSCVIFDARMWHWVLPVFSGNRISYALFVNAY